MKRRLPVLNIPWNPKDSQGWAPGNPLRIPAESEGILGMWGLGPGNASTKDKYCCPYTRLENWNQKILAVPLKNGNRCFKMRFAGQFFLWRCSFPTISMRLQKRFRILTDESLRLEVARKVHFSKGSQVGTEIQYSGPRHGAAAATTRRAGWPLRYPVCPTVCHRLAQDLGPRRFPLRGWPRT